MKKPSLLPLIMLILLIGSCNSRQEANYDEQTVPNYSLPEILVSAEGVEIQSVDEWKKERRGELLRIFEKEMYGYFPSGHYEITFESEVRSDTFLDHSALLKEVNAYVETGAGKHHFLMLLVVPVTDHPVPVFIGLNFYGNHTTDTSGLITITDTWVRNNEAKNITGNRASEASRGSSGERWPYQQLINSGYGLCTAYYGDFDPDYEDGFRNGMHPLFAEASNPRNEHSSGSISIWAKGMSMMVDYLQTDSLVDEEKIIAIGHSRLGKTSLWAGANDERFAAVISNNSGCGGAALSRRRFGETVERINTSFPHWFCERFKTYNGKEKKLPVDQHMLLALIAPRPVYVASATEDLWADPKGEFLALKAAQPVYELLGGSQDFPAEQPLPDQPYSGLTGYHLRTGPHNITDYDWQQFMDWADRWVK